MKTLYLLMELNYQLMYRWIYWSLGLVQEARSLVWGNISSPKILKWKWLLWSLVKVLCCQAAILDLTKFKASEQALCLEFWIRMFLMKSYRCGFCAQMYLLLQQYHTLRKLLLEQIEFWLSLPRDSDITQSVARKIETNEVSNLQMYICS